MFGSRFLAVLSIFSSVAVNAAPFAGQWGHRFTSCDISKAHLSLPSNQSTVSVASSSKVEYITLGLGVQNYTCSSGVWTSIGAVASLYDISCLWGTELFGSVAQLAYDLPSKPTPEQIAARFPYIKALQPLAHHFFVNNPIAAGVTPRFNLEPFKGTYVTAKKDGNIPSPAGPSNVDWLKLSNIEGTMAQTVYRVNTVAGQPPAACTAGAPDLSVKYTALYWFYK